MLYIVIFYNSFPASGEFCCLLITYANSLDPDQDEENVGPDLYVSKPFDTCIVFLKEFLEKVNFEKKVSRRQKKPIKNYPACNELTLKAARKKCI